MKAVNYIVPCTLILWTAVGLVLPTTTQAQWSCEPTTTLFPPPPQKGGFGLRVAVDADTVVVGSPDTDTAGGQGNGVVAVYHALTGALLFALNNPRPGDYAGFGLAVAVSGTRVVVGARNDNTGAAGAGAVYVFDLCSATPTVPIATLNNPSPAVSELFGQSVAISGTRVVVGAVFDSTHAFNAGSAYVYDLASATPTVPIVILTNPSPVDFGNFGISVAVSGNRVVVGAQWNDIGADNAGAAYVYDLGSATPSVPMTVLNNPNPVIFGGFGASLAMSGNRVVVGAANDNSGVIGAGVVYVFDLGSVTPTVPALTLPHPDPSDDDRFGSALAISGTRVVIGAYQEDNAAIVTDPVYVYDLASLTPTVPVARLNNPSPASYDYFGAAVAVSGSRVVIGAYQDDTFAINAGAAYVFDLGSLTPTVPLATLSNPGPSDRGFGTSVAVSGQLLVVGSPGDPTGASGAGAAYAFDLGSAAPGAPIAVWQNPSPAAYELFGEAVAVSGMRVAVGAPRDQTGAMSAGAVHLFELASATPTMPVLTLTNPSPASGDEFGSAVAMSGDLVVVGAHRDSASAVNAGTAYVYDLSSATPTVPIVILSNPNPTPYASFGISVGIAENRVVVGAYQHSTGAVYSGTVYAFDLASGTRLNLHNPSPAVNDYFGYAVAIAGARVVVGAYNKDIGAIDSGRAYVYDLASPTPTVPRWLLDNPNPALHTQFGISVAIANNRVVLGSRAKTGTSAGSAFLYDLDAATPTVPRWTLKNPGRDREDNFGKSIAVLGTRVVIGAPQTDSLNRDAGAAHVFETGAKLRLEQPAGTILVRETTSVNFAAVALGGSSSRTFTLRSIGFEDLSGLAIAFDGPHGGDFALASALDASVPAGAGTFFTVAFTPADLGPRTAMLHLTSNDADESPFVITLTGLGVADGDADGDGLSNFDELNLHGTNPDLADSDGDGIGDGAEVNLAAFGFDPRLESSSRLALLQDNALGAGLYRARDVQNLALGHPLLERDLGTGRFRLRLGVERSPNFSDWMPLIGFAPTYDEATGQITLEFAPDADSAQFYRVFGGKP